MKACEIADGIKSVSKALKKSGDVLHTVLNDTADEIERSWVINQLDCANYLTEEEFETLQGLIKKVELMKNGKQKKNSKQKKPD